MNPLPPGSSYNQDFSQHHKKLDFKTTSSTSQTPTETSLGRKKIVKEDNAGIVNKKNIALATGLTGAIGTGVWAALSSSSATPPFTKPTEVIPTPYSTNEIAMLGLGAFGIAAVLLAGISYILSSRRTETQAKPPQKDTSVVVQEIRSFLSNLSSPNNIPDIPLSPEAQKGVNGNLKGELVNYVLNKDDNFVIKLAGDWITHQPNHPVTIKVIETLLEICIDNKNGELGLGIFELCIANTYTAIANSNPDNTLNKCVQHLETLFNSLSATDKVLDLSRVYQFIYIHSVVDSLEYKTCKETMYNILHIAAQLPDKNTAQWLVSIVSQGLVMGKQQPFVEDTILTNFSKLIKDVKGAKKDTHLKEAFFANYIFEIGTLTKSILPSKDKVNEIVLKAFNENLDYLLKKMILKN